MTDYDSQTRAKLIKRSTKVLQRLNETLKNADLVVAFVIANKSEILCVKLGEMAIKRWTWEEPDEGPVHPPSEKKFG